MLNDKKDKISPISQPQSCVLVEVGVLMLSKTVFHCMSFESLRDL